MQLHKSNVTYMKTFFANEVATVLLVAEIVNEDYRTRLQRHRCQKVA